MDPFLSERVELELRLVLRFFFVTLRPRDLLALFDAAALDFDALLFAPLLLDRLLDFDFLVSSLSSSDFFDAAVCDAADFFDFPLDFDIALSERALLADLLRSVSSLSLPSEFATLAVLLRLSLFDLFDFASSLARDLLGDLDLLFLELADDLLRPRSFFAGDSVPDFFPPLLSDPAADLLLLRELLLLCCDPLRAEPDFWDFFPADFSSSSFSDFFDPTLLPRDLCSLPSSLSPTDGLALGSRDFLLRARDGLTSSSSALSPALLTEPFSLPSLLFTSSPFTFCGDSSAADRWVSSTVFSALSSSLLAPDLLDAFDPLLLLRDCSFFSGVTAVAFAFAFASP